MTAVSLKILLALRFNNGIYITQLMDYIYVGVLRFKLKKFT